MPELNIVLIEPQIPQNTGNISRTCAVTGSRLHIIKPMGFAIDDTKLKRAGLDYWHMLDITYYDDINEFYNKNDGAFYFFTTKATTTHSDVKYPDKVYIFFGREDKGIDEKILLAHKENCVRIPMVNEARSINLSNTVAVAAYEVLRQWNYPNLSSNIDKITMSGGIDNA
ncbi:MAG: tRNA (cytidine(34)-2'-O)-methyltransferase [Clostridiales bacterium]|nr:tRNA (cytidine(34)-2'-O)-methyltransferase [Clostridiales bacterium]